MHALAVERLQQIVDRIHLKRLHRILIERRRKHHLRQLHLAILRQYLLQHGEAIQPRHANIQEDHVWFMSSDQFHGLNAVGPLRQHRHIPRSLQQVQQLLPRQRLIVNNQGCQRSCHAANSVRARGASLRSTLYPLHSA